MKNKNYTFKDLFEVFSLSFICLFVGYLIFTELETNKRCIPNENGQSLSRCH